MSAVKKVGQLKRVTQRHHFGLVYDPEHIWQTKTSLCHRTNASELLQPIYSWDDLSARFRAIAARGRTDSAHFFRHGATKYNERNLVSGQHDTKLTELGREQARRLRSSMPKQIDLIVCSSLQRSLETMSLSVSQDCWSKTGVVIDRRLNEVNLGALQGRRRKFISHFAKGDLDFRPEGGESYRQAAQRVLSVVADLFDVLARQDDRSTCAVVFCHAGVLRIISTLVGGRGNPRELFSKGFANTESVALFANTIQLPSFWIGGSD